tara:strand:- start:27035 stop:27232 length:198 start_codon:yes stop_codon:yes gene_type:complete
MNDFTKEELVKLWRCINPVIIGDDAYDLKIKVRDMIDNYCEHAEHHYYGDIAAAECKQCGMVILP